MRERGCGTLLSLRNYAMKLCIEGDIYFIPKFHILETETVKLSIETGLRNREYNSVVLRLII
jgi:hypothetical protein